MTLSHAIMQKTFKKEKKTERFKSYTYDEIIKRDKTSLDIFWLKGRIIN